MLLSSSSCSLGALAIAGHREQEGAQERHPQAEAPPQAEPEGCMYLLYTLRSLSLLVCLRCMMHLARVDIAVIDCSCS